MKQILRRSENGVGTGRSLDLEVDHITNSSDPDLDSVAGCMRDTAFDLDHGHTLPLAPDLDSPVPDSHTLPAVFSAAPSQHQHQHQHH